MSLTLRSYLIGLAAQVILAGLSHVEKLSVEHEEWIEKQVKDICKVDMLDELAWKVAKELMPRIFDLAQEQVKKFSEKMTAEEQAQAVAAIVQTVAQEAA